MGLFTFADSISRDNKYRSKNRDINYFMLVSLKYYYDVDFSNQILKNIWLGNYLESSNEQFMKKNNIKVIINCTKDLPFFFSKSEVPYQYRLPVNDDRQDNSIYTFYLYLSKLVENIKWHVRQNHNIYIHCRAGMQRSASLLCAYIMNDYNLSMDDSIAYIRERRNIAFVPVNNFRTALEKYEKDLKSR